MAIPFQLIAALFAAYGAVQQGQAARRQADTQATIQDQQAARERQEAAIAEESFRRNQSRLQARRRAQLGASGVESGEGSPLFVSEDIAAETEFEALRIKSGGEVRETRLQQQAGQTRFAGRQAQRAGFTRGGSLLISSFGKRFR